MSDAEAEALRDQLIEHHRHVLRTRTWQGNDGDRDAIREALGALAQIGAAASHAAAEVLELAASPRADIRDAAVAALGALMPEVVARAVAEAAAVPAFRARAIAVVGAVPPASPLAAALRELPAIADHLFAALASEPSAHTRGTILQALGGHLAGDPRLLAALERASADPDPALRRMVGRAAIASGDAAVPLLATLLRDLGQADTSAAHALAAIGTAAARAALTAFLRAAGSPDVPGKRRKRRKPKTKTKPKTKPKR